MKAMISAVAIACLLAAGAASAQSGSQSNPPSAQNSGAGIQGAPGNKNGPPADKGTVGSSTSMDRHNPDVSNQDPANVKGMPGNKSGPAVKSPSKQ
ncbi:MULTISPECIES: hypothetical protein [unclassified Bradyrhizobium]|uniref:hypothetical protein n=1 Tax=unclassified Bradyrhizobium TaxID=2631580 RepID=UPI0028E7AA1A|nr:MULTISPECIES: hypothetical protein [unclassified Bradyrhizobium]